MKIGMNLPVMEPGLDRGVLLEWIRRIDEGPFSSVALGERIAFTNPEVLTTLAACAAVTQRVRIVSTVVVLPIHDPVLLAKQLATIDVLSDGRLSVGVGIGGREEDYRSVSADLSMKRNAALPGLVDTLRRVWAGERVVDTLEPVGPEPVQPGGPEVLAGALGPKAVTMAASWADGICGFDWGPSLEGIESTFSRARDAWKQVGREEAPRLITSFWFALGEAARDQVSSHLRRYMNYMDADVVEDLLPTTGFAGSGAELVSLLARVEDLGADEVLLTPTNASPDEVSRVADLIG
ncbi:MAG: LLM class flavin-dependent oxidoreductase [Myxococcales bacterium]|nr:LLM class flavin-dependent oxidoreductase [Myxococcales bacterium]